MQLMPATADELHVSDPFDPGQNIQAGAAYLKRMLDRYKGDLRLALIAYNAGPSRADHPQQNSQSLPPSPLETQNYVAGIFAELGITQWNEAEEAMESSASRSDNSKPTPPDKAEAPPLTTTPARIKTEPKPPGTP